VIVDAIIALLLIGVVLRGWRRGVLRETVDIVGLVVSLVLAFRLAPAVGVVVRALTGMEDDAARFVGGLTVLSIAGVGLVLASRAAERRIGSEEPSMASRGWGAGLAAAWGVFIVTVLVTLSSVLPMPPSVDDQLEASAMTRVLTNPDGPPQAVFGRLAGDRVITTLLALRRTMGDRRIVIGPDDMISIPAARPEDLRRDHAAADEVFDLLNLARLDAGVSPVAWSEALAEVALGHAYDMYLDGFFAHDSPTTGGLGDRLRAASITFRFAGENLALAVTPQEIHRGLMESPGHRANILGPEYRRVGVAVVSGRLGLMTVQVFTG
jgi:uncharacterized membrane protein required for colicin V production